MVMWLSISMLPIHAAHDALLQSHAQVGRAGRDGREAQCWLYLDDSDYLSLRSLAHSTMVLQASVSRFMQCVFEGMQPGQYRYIPCR